VRYIYGILAVAFYLIGFGGCALAKTSIGEISSMIMVVIGTLFFIAAGIVEALNEIRNEVRKHHS
jgi:ABC-type methionine transport system permease subunit